MRAQLPNDAAADDAVKLPEATWEELFDGDLFRQENPPRWVLFLAGSDIFLLDRHKWPQGKYLHFELGELLGRRQLASLKATAALLHRDILDPAEGQCLHDTLDENSHKHAFAVSTDLKHGARRAVELLANEVVFYRREVLKKGVFDDEELAKKLTAECLSYLYRLLFLFYVEARGGELGVVPMKSDAYREGYSLETLRDLELVPLTTAEARDGYYLHHSLERLFELVNIGFGGGQRALTDVPAHETFFVSGLRSPLFDRERTPLLSETKLRNAVLQEVLQLLSLSREAGRKKDRGRISYAQLGINQLGAVYEGLLSFSGFFAREDLYEVRAEDDGEDSEARTYFVPKKEIDRYKKSEIATGDDGKPVVHRKGSFIFRLAGRDREKSASYYTPEVLTRCVTKYTLMERLKRLTADEILKLTVCEPAMGSGAFLNEAVNQLADVYLERKQEELRERIPADRYQLERQRVKYYLAVNNCYGVDLNPLAVELAKVSLWLNVLHEGARAPWFGLRLATGNSLIGARREVFRAEDLLASEAKDRGRWLGKVPEKVPFGADRPKDSVWHFLVPDEGMAPFDTDKVVGELEPDAVKRIKAWRKEMCRPFTPMEVEQLKKLSARIDELWTQHAAQRADVINRTRQPIEVWGQPKPEGDAARWKSVDECEEWAGRLESEASSWSRLQAAMNYWCSLWFWPIGETSVLPARSDWIADLRAILDGASDRSRRTRTMDRVATDRRFHHWEGRFAEAFVAGGGLDLLLGNPPWSQIAWMDADYLSDHDPSIAVQKLSARQTVTRRADLLKNDAIRHGYFADLVETTATISFLGSAINFPVLRGAAANLYKCFLARSWNIGANGSRVGLLHQTGIFDDPNGGGLRRALSLRLDMVALFRNELKLFEGIGNVRPYCFTVSAPTSKATPGFTLVGSLFHPRTIDESLNHDGVGPVPAVRGDDGGWELRGHRARLVHVNANLLAVFCALFDPPGTDLLEARLPSVHCTQTVAVLRQFAGASRRLRDYHDRYVGTEGFHETNEERDGNIKRKTDYPAHVSGLVLSGPHIFVGNPLSKTPRKNCATFKDYDCIDLEEIEPAYLPRTNYVIVNEGEKKFPSLGSRSMLQFFRHVNRKMFVPTTERSLIGAIIPPSVTHLNSMFSIALESEETMLAFSGMCASLPVDFFVRSSGKANCHNDLLELLPIPEPGTSVARAIARRALRLNCLTRYYAPLWQRHWHGPQRLDVSSTDDPRAQVTKSLGEKWSQESSPRTAFARRQLLVELDALSAISLGLTVEDLLFVYRFDFAVLRSYENETFYDSEGRIVFTNNKGLPGVGLSRAEWNEVSSARSGDRLPAFASRYAPPFDRRDRETDTRQAYDHFVRLLMSGAPSATTEVRA